MTEIRPNQEFKHEKKTYKKGRKYQVSEEDAEYFLASGWVGESAESGKAQTLDVHGGTLGQTSEVN